MWIWMWIWMWIVGKLHPKDSRRYSSLLQKNEKWLEPTKPDDDDQSSSPSACGNN